MKQKNVTAICLAAAIIFGLFSVNANAFTVWAVEGGASSSSNMAGSPLDLSAGAHAIDLYFDTEGDVSWGWSILLDVTGIGTVSAVTGGDIKGGMGTPQPDGGWQQFGGDFAVDLNAPSVLMFSFVFDAAPGAILSIGSGSTYGSATTYADELITLGDLVKISAVPLPAAVWLLFSGIGLLGFAAKSKRAKTAV